MSRTLLFLFFLLLGIFNNFTYANVKQEYIEEKISQISIEDRKKIEELFRYLFKDLHLGYVLFGSEKPVSYERFRTDFSWDWFLFPREKHRSYLGKLWNIWENYADYFPSSRFVLKRLEYYDEEGILIHEYLFMDLVKCRKIMRKNRSLFPDNSPSEILSSIQKEGMNFLKNHEAIGLLLGYDQGNVSLFQQRETCLEKLASETPIPSMYSSLDEIDLFNIRILTKKNSVLPSHEFRNHIDRYKDISKRISQTSLSLISRSPLSLLSLPAYVVDCRLNSGYQKMESYQKEEKKLAAIFNDEQFLRIIVERLCEIS